MEQEEKKPEGAFVGLIIIIIILVVGGIYIWHSKIKQMEQQKLQDLTNTKVSTTVNSGN